MSVCFPVISLPRSGSSALAGAMHKMGIFMGHQLQPADVNNPRGYFEDLEFQAVSKAIAGERYTVNWPARELPEWIKPAYSGIIERRNIECDLWGMKGPRMCFTFHVISQCLEEAGVEARMVVIQREFKAVQASLVQHSRDSYHGQHEMGAGQAGDLLSKWESARNKQIGWFDGQFYRVFFEDMIENTESCLRELLTWAYEGDEHPFFEQRLKAGIRHIESDLVHWS